MDALARREVPGSDIWSHEQYCLILSDAFHQEIAGSRSAASRFGGRADCDAARIRSCGRAVIGGPDEIHLAVEDVLGSDGTVMMFVGCQEGFDDVGRGGLILDPDDRVLVGWVNPREGGGQTQHDLLSRTRCCVGSSLTLDPTYAIDQAETV